MIVVLFKMLEKMQNNGANRITRENVLVPFSSANGGIKNVTKQLLTKLLKQKILGFKMRVKRGSANVSGFYNFSYGYFFVMLF